MARKRRTRRNPSSSLDTLAVVGLAGGVAYLGYRLVKAQQQQQASVPRQLQTLADALIPHGYNPSSPVSATNNPYASN